MYELKSLPQGMELIIRVQEMLLQSITQVFLGMEVDSTLQETGASP